jgi:hypothetical protein
VPIKLPNEHETLPKKKSLQLTLHSRSIHCVPTEFPNQEPLSFSLDPSGVFALLQLCFWSFILSLDCVRRQLTQDYLPLSMCQPGFTH